MREWKRVKLGYEHRLGIPAGRGVPMILSVISLYSIESFRQDLQDYQDGR